jgi:hypothetical protein
MLFDSGRSFSDSMRGLDGATLELLPSSSSKSASPVTLGEDESRLSPSCCELSAFYVTIHAISDFTTHFIVVPDLLAAIPLSLVLLETLRLSPFCATILFRGWKDEIV